MWNSPGRRKARIHAYTRDTPDNIWHLVNERKGGAPGLFLPVLKQRAFHVAVFAAPYLDSQTKEMSVGRATLPYLILKSSGRRSPGVIPRFRFRVILSALAASHLGPGPPFATVEVCLARAQSPSRVTHEARNSCNCFLKMGEMTEARRSLQGNLCLTAYQLQPIFEGYRSPRVS